MKLIIAKIDEKIYEGEFEKVKLPGLDGDLEVMPGHAALITPLTVGTFSYVVAGVEKSIEIEKGILEVNADEVIVIL